MKHFTTYYIEEAVEYARNGGMALHTHRIIVDWTKTPRCFRDTIARGEDIAHLFDQDKDRLIQTARNLGVNVILVEREGTPDQHIDLCGKPLNRAINGCDKLGYDNSQLRLNFP